MMYPFFEFPDSFKDFVKRCLLFRSDSRLNRILGLLAWSGILLLSYALCKIFLLVYARL